MEFPYYKVIDFPKHQKREKILPWFRFGIFNPQNTSKIVYPLGLVDSGSDLTIIDHELGEELGFNIKKGKKTKVVGVGGGYIEGYLHRIGFNIEDFKNKKKSIIYEDLGLFTYKKFPKSMPQQTSILGTLGFFRNLEITLKYPDVIIINLK